MKIIKGKMEESYSTYDIQTMIEDGTLGVNCSNIIDNLRYVAFDVAKTDKLEKYCKKYYRSATGILDIIVKCTELLENVNKKG